MTLAIGQPATDTSVIAKTFLRRQPCRLLALKGNS